MISIKNKKGYVMLLTTIIFMMVSLIIILGLSTPTINQIFSARDIWGAKQSYYLSESGVEDIIYRLKDSTMSLNVGSPENLSLDGYNTITSIVDTTTGKIIISSSNENGYKKNIEAKIIQGAWVSFDYGIFAGDGGLNICNNCQVLGNTYSDGDITGSDGAKIVGSAVVTSGSQIIGNNYTYIGASSTNIAWAKDVSGVNLIGNLYCLTGTNNANEKVCDTSHGISDVVTAPVSEKNINQWKAEALKGGVNEGDYLVNKENDVIGSSKISGDVIVEGGSTLMVTGTLWVVGNVTLTDGAKIKLSPDFGKNSSIILADGYVNINGNSVFEGSGTSGSYPIVVSTSICSITNHCQNNNSAISLSGGAGSIVLVAPYGDVNINGSSGARSVMGHSITLSGGASVTYDSGLANLSFSTSSSVGWVISGWKELEN